MQTYKEIENYSHQNAEVSSVLLTMALWLHIYTHSMRNRQYGHLIEFLTMHIAYTHVVNIGPASQMDFLTQMNTELANRNMQVNQLHKNRTPPCTA